MKAGESSHALHKKIAEKYGVHPSEISRVTDRLYLINDGHNRYAVKKFSMTEDNLSLFEQVYHRASIDGLSSIAPVCLTQRNEIYTEHSGSYFYMTPWLPASEDNPGKSTENALIAIGKIHAGTRQTRPIDLDSVAVRFRDYQKSCAALHEQSLNYITSFEKKRFMSPFELLACTQYRIFNETLHLSEKHTEEFLEGLAEEPEWSYSLCRGKLDLSHICDGQYTYLVNWDRAKFDSPIFDLLHFFQSMVYDHHITFENMKNAMESYIGFNKLSEREHHLLAIYLLNPFPYIKLLRDYSDNPSSNSMVSHSKFLRAAGRRLQFGLDYSKFVADGLTSENELESEED